MQSENAVIELNRAHLWQIALFSLNNTSTNLYLAMMGYVSYYANGIAGLSVVVISFILTGMRIFDGVTDPVIGYVIDKTNGRFGKFRPFMISGYVLLAGSSLVLFLRLIWCLRSLEFRILLPCILYTLSDIHFRRRL